MCIRDRARPPSTTPPIIAGWWTDETSPQKDRAKWYREEIPRTETWAFKEGDPQKHIAALEMMGTLVLFKLIGHHCSTSRHAITTLKTDNQANVHSLTKERAKKWPGADIMMELVVAAQRVGATPHIIHVKRGYNIWADQLTHHPPDLQGFDPARRHRFDLADDTNWDIWHTLRQRPTW